MGSCEKSAEALAGLTTTALDPAISVRYTDTHTKRKVVLHHSGPYFGKISPLCKASFFLITMTLDPETSAR